MYYNLIIGTTLGVLFTFLIVAGAYWYSRKQQNHRFSKTFKLTPSGTVLAPIFMGIYRRYQFAISPFRDVRKKNRFTLTKVAVKMQNPNGKILILEKKGKILFPDLLTDEKAECSAVNHLEPAITGLTNDVFMLGIIFTDEIKRQIEARMKEVSCGMIYLFKEELVFLSPVFAGEGEAFSLWAQQMDLLADIKDVLQ